jgi:thiol-disulfide isomerase/thioredoxin
MKKKTFIPYIRLFLFLSLAPLVYFFWEWGGAERLLKSVHAPVTVEAIRVGTPAPDFQIDASRTWVKKEFRVSTTRGFPVILHFWATWCGPCLQELPEIIRLAERYRPQGYTFVAVAIDDSWATVENFFGRYPALKAMTNTMVMVLDPNARVANSYGSSRFPETFLINDQMLIDNKFIGAQPWNDPRMEPYLGSLRTAPQP